MPNSNLQVAPAKMNVTDDTKRWVNTCFSVVNATLLQYDNSNICQNMETNDTVQTDTHHASNSGRFLSDCMVHGRYRVSRHSVVLTTRFHMQKRRNVTYSSLPVDAGFISQLSTPRGHQLRSESNRDRPLFRERSKTNKRSFIEARYGGDTTAEGRIDQGPLGQRCVTHFEV